MDNHNVTSVVQRVQVLICSGCSGPKNGSCDFNDILPSDTWAFHRVRCACKPAYVGDNCERERDGCAANPCQENQACTDIKASVQMAQADPSIGYTCGRCPAGFQSQPGTTICIDNNECQSGNNPCQGTCTNTYGGYECGCAPGLRLKNDKHDCADINECLEGTHGCDQLCVNTHGSYHCDCEDGYQFNTATRRCEQNNAFLQEACRFAGCEQGCKNATAVNGTNEGGLQCFCFQGYRNRSGDHSMCEDRNECKEGLCTQSCFNYDGGFSCSCYAGYSLAEDRVTCLPCPPLRYGPNCQLECRCNGRAKKCDNVTGCVCRDGWSGDHCEQDVNECEQTNVRPDPPCGAQQLCRNLPGSFQCECLPGYKNVSGACVGKCTLY